MTEVTATTNVQPPRWEPTDDELERILAALRTEAYPPNARWGVGPTRKVNS